MSGMTKAERLNEMKRLYIQRAFSDIDMAERLDTRRETVFRYRKELETEYPFIQDDTGRWKIDRTQFISEIKVNLHEALTLYLAARKTSRQTRYYHPHAASAVEKLAGALRQPMAGKLLKTADTVLKQEKDPERIKIIETLAQAWVEQKKVRIRYKRFGSENFVNHTISPYLIEPSIWSDSIYAIALSDVTEKLIAFRCDRIESAFLTGEGFEIPVDFDEQELLKHAWGIWYGDKEPVTVKLRFSKNVIRRVKESTWHPLERVKDTEDGGCLWSAEVAEWREMLPWIRGWGADVEVLNPESLREKLKREIRQMGKLYGTNLDQTPKYFSLWAKAEKSHNPEIHSLIYHLLDVGECTLALWNLSLSEQTRQLFAQSLGLDIESTGRQLAFWASLHDLGKATPGFQRKYREIIPELQSAGFSFPPETLSPAPHGIVSAWALKDLLIQETGMSKKDARDIASALGGHHGRWPTSDRLGPAALQPSDKGGQEWDGARMELFRAVQQIYSPSSAVAIPDDYDEIVSRNVFLALFSGLVSVADWIGSIAENFDFVDEYMLPQEYALLAREKAHKALQKLGWLGWQATGEFLSFAAMFPDTPVPYPVQKSAIEFASSTSLPALLILEAPTGIGKTEAALFLADTWLQSKKSRGMYVAMPTQATSNQMYERVVRFLKERYPGEKINAHLVHSGALIDDDNEKTPELQDVSREEKGEGSIKAETWFLPRKRTLLAPFGVGTVDQALMSVLQTNHFFVRIFGLGQKVIIFDEVHAYDTYMSTLFERLLHWLRSIGTSVILLSATLPETTRQKFVGAWMENDDGKTTLPKAEYPRLTLVSDDNVSCHPLPAPAKRTVCIHQVDPSPGQVIGHLSEMIRERGCVAVMCNRVQRAQEVYQAIQSAGLVEPENLILFHARFPFSWRKKIEEKVLSLFSKTGQRPQKAIVVATQVIEQSLDLDFDYMISDLAPVDLLLQRAGRLHRHKHDRPEGMKEPILTLAIPPEKNGLPTFGKDTFIYDESTLLSTWLLLQEREEIVLPAQTEDLIEAVYGDNLPFDLSENILERLRKSREDARKKRETEVAQAKTRLIPGSDYEDLIVAPNEALEEDDPNVHEAFRAMTRLGEPGVSIICLHQTVQGLALELDGSGSPLNIRARPNLALAKKLLLKAVNIQHRDVVNYVTKHEEPTAEWKRSAAVRNHYPLVFDQNGEYRPDDAKFYLKLTQELGLQVFKKESR